MDDAILARADALMQRRRPPPAEADDVPVLTAVVGMDDDLPILTEAAAFAGPAVIKPPPTADKAPADSQTEFLLATPDPQTRRGEAENAELIAALADELARRVEQQLVALIPGLIASALRGILAEHGISGRDKRDR